MPLENQISLAELGIVAITFDLDDTLWPCAPVIQAAEQVYFDWIDKRFPEITSQYSLADMIAMRRSILDSEPLLKNDVTELRRRATVALMQPFGASEEDMAEAMRVCIDARQQITFYDEVLTALQQLSFHYRLGSITNGNASLEAIGVGHLFDVELAATMELPAKPAADMFLSACKVLGTQPERVLHVGDHPQNDVAAARMVGCKTAWINRTDEIYPEDAVPADLSIVNLNELVKLAPPIPG